MAMFKDFTFDGENSKDYGVYISGDAVYDAPERAMDMVQIPGRNGALALDNGYYKNIDVTYPAGCFAGDQADFAAKLSRIRNMLASRHRYCRLEDAYHPDYFRMALYKSGLDVSPVARNKAGRFNIIFDAKPQRFLKSGEVVQELDADAPPTTSYGPADIVTFEGKPGDAIVHGQWPLEPIQDLHGYDSPWPAGGGVNLFEYPALDLTRRGVTFKTDNGKIKITGMADGANVLPYDASVVTTYSTMRFGPYPAGTYTIKGDFPSVSGGTRAVFQAKYADGANVTNANSFVLNEARSFTATAEFKCDVWINIQDGDTVDITSEVSLNAGSAAQTWTPYSNLCPIQGFTEAKITDAGENLFAPVSGTYTNSGVTFAWADGKCTVTGTATGGNAFNGPISRYLPAGTYTIINFNQTAGAGFFVSDTTVSNWITLANTLNHTDAQGNGYDSFTLTKPTVVAMRARVNLGTTVDGVVITPMVVEGSVVPSDYTSYVGTTHNITWQNEAGTVYGGLLEYLGGQAWRLTKTMEIVDMGDLNWTLSASIFVGTLSNAKPTSGLEPIPSALCSTYPTAAYNALLDKQFTISTGGKAWVKDSAYNDASLFKTAVTGQTICYELAIPVVCDLTEDALQALIGTNNIFSNTGTTTITVQSPYELENPTLYPSKPLIRVYGSGSIQVNDITITVAQHSGYIDIDCDMMDCHRGADSMNQYVSFSGNDFPELQPGINRILLNGPDKVEITPRWWEL